MKGIAVILFLFTAVHCPGYQSMGEEFESECYHFFYPPRYLPYSEIARLAHEADRRCHDLKGFLKIERKGRIPVYVQAGEGISNTEIHANRAIELYYLKPIRGIRAPLVHETTHILLNCRVNLMREGIAVAMERRFGEICTHPTYGFDLDSWMKAILLSGRYVPLRELENSKWSAGPLTEAIISYCESGSFCEYLIEEFGISSFLRLVRLLQKNERLTLDGAMKGIFMEGLDDLEKKWIRNVKGRKVNHEEVLLLKEAMEKENLQPLLLKRMEDR